MFILASISIVRTSPVPTILVLLDSLKKEFTNNVRSTSLNYFSFFITNHFIELVLA